ncbi:ADP-ribosylation factor-binding protein GGA [Paragonimus westermani]|uniref:ADP-ribosylation factor-binding protein GGA n=1 Tax=Paragonimus westermani TaxID=34504 RepID=A0A5J4NYW6_9TREM|nr:ADP-ribosylation factor-binding protein GGA [Paragonimus westermani]
MNALEDLLNEAISPSNRHYNSETVRRIAELINKEPNGPPFALRLIAHKIQSPQDREALTALNLLNYLTKQCNPSFLSELGKFKFLNEIIKVLSPKYLADQCTPAVKQKCAQLLYEWQRDYADKEPKISEAYNMLCRQGIINPEELSSNCPMRSDRLTKLLRSRNPADVAEANRLIKTIVEEDQLRLEQVTQRSTEMEALKNNTLLLEEMTNTYERGEASEAELELMSELAQNIRRARPLLYNFSLTHDENDIQALSTYLRVILVSEIACICDQASTALTLYEQTVANPINGSRFSQRTIVHDPLSNKDDKRVEKDLLSQDLLALGLDDDEKLNTVPIITPAVSLSQTLSASAASKQCLYQTAKSDATRYGELADIFANVSFIGPATGLQFGV